MTHTFVFSVSSVLIKRDVDFKGLISILAFLWRVIVFKVTIFVIIIVYSNVKLTVLLLNKTGFETVARIKTVPDFELQR